MHHSREKREQAVPCKACRKPTFEFDRRCQDCAEAATTPPCTDSYFTFDLDTQRVEVPPFRLDPATVMAEIVTALEPA